MEREGTVPPDPIEAFVQRASSGSKGGSKILAENLRSDPTLVSRVVPLLLDPRPNVRAGAAEALSEVSEEVAPHLAPHIEVFLSALQKGEADSRTISAVFEAVGPALSIRPEPFDGEGLSSLESFLKRRPKAESARSAYRALGRWGKTSPERAQKALRLFSRALSGKPKEPVARAILESLEDLASSPIGLDRGRIRALTSPLRGHPSPLVRERASRLVEELGG